MSRDDLITTRPPARACSTARARSALPIFPVRARARSRARAERARRAARRRIRRAPPAVRWGGDARARARAAVPPSAAMCGASRAASPCRAPATGADAPDVPHQHAVRLRVLAPRHGLLPQVRARAPRAPARARARARLSPPPPSFLARVRLKHVSPPPASSLTARPTRARCSLARALARALARPFVLAVEADDGTLREIAAAVAAAGAPLDDAAIRAMSHEEYAKALIDEPELAALAVDLAVDGARGRSPSACSAGGWRASATARACRQRGRGDGRVRERAPPRAEPGVGAAARRRPSCAVRPPPRAASGCRSSTSRRRSTGCSRARRRPRPPPRRRRGDAGRARVAPRVRRRGRRARGRARGRAAEPARRAARGARRARRRARDAAGRRGVGAGVR